MKNRFWFLFVIVSLGLISWGVAQNTRNDLFDLKKSQQELEIMRGILGTTLSFVVREIQGKDDSSRAPIEEAFSRSGWGFSNISAFYLYGQGAVFVIPGSSFRNLFGLQGKKAMESLLVARAALVDAERVEAELDARSEEMAELAAALEGVRAGVAGGVVGGVPGGVVGGVVGGVPGGVEGGVPGKPRSRASTEASQPQPPQVTAATPTQNPRVAVPPPPERVAQAPRPAGQGQGTTRSQEEIRKKLAEAQERVKKRREETAAKRVKFLEQLSQIKVYLVETLANHGDSLTHVKPNEYITIIITTDEGDLVFQDSFGTRSHREVLSVQKSAVADYKAGRLTLEAFKQKVLSYNN